MRISDWSSDVCSSDLVGMSEPCRVWHRFAQRGAHFIGHACEQRRVENAGRDRADADRLRRQIARRAQRERKSVVEGKSVSVRVAFGGLRSNKKKNTSDKTLKIEVIYVEQSKDI